MELSIGEFSRASRLPVKTIRYYQEEGILAPRRTDPDSGYRYYDDAAMERARILMKLRELNFSIAEIRELLAGERQGAGGPALLERKVLQLDETIERCRTARRGPWRRSTSAAPGCFCPAVPTSTSPRSACSWPEP